MARLLALARATLGDGARAGRWLKRNIAPGGVAPIAAIDTELGPARWKTFSAVLPMAA